MRAYTTRLLHREGIVKTIWMIDTSLRLLVSLVLLETAIDFVVTSGLVCFLQGSQPLHDVRMC